MKDYRTFPADLQPEPYCCKQIDCRKIFQLTTIISFDDFVHKIEKMANLCLQ